MTIKRFYVRDGVVLDEHPEGNVVRYDHHLKRVGTLKQVIQDFIDTNEVGSEDEDYWLTPLYRALKEDQ